MQIRNLFFLAVLLGMLGFVGGAQAQDEAAPECTSCHEIDIPAKEVHAKEPCLGCHLGADGVVDEDAGHAEPVSNETCVSCHDRAEKHISRSVHGLGEDTPSCESCHGKPHNILPSSEWDSRLSAINQNRTCGRCHKDMMEPYLEGVHARAVLDKGLNDAPACTDCHGTHAMRSSDDKLSGTHFGKIPDTCGDCHEGVLRTFMDESAHGVAFAEGDENAPVCTTCHDAHQTLAMEGQARMDSAAQCGTCHEELYVSFLGSFHGKAINLGMESSAVCTDCHTAHVALGPDDPRSSVHPNNLDETCGACHGEVNEAFLSFNPHSIPSDPDSGIEVYYIFLFMTALLLSVFAFFFLHDMLWLQRALVGKLRGEFKSRPIADGPHVRRFTTSHMLTHMTIVSSFLLLAATGLPLKFHMMDWAQWTVNLFGGLETAMFLHRVAAVVTFGYAIYHLLDLFFNSFRKHGFSIFWGPESLVPQMSDVKELWGNFRYFLYLGPRPDGGRWSYWEKFDYFAVFWGIPIIGGSGLVLWFPNFFAGFLPGWALNAASVIHSDEALLATGFIFVFHFFHTHMRPESFPMDPVMFTGSMPLERFKEERAHEYQLLVETGRLEERMVPPPTKGQLMRGYIFGTTGLVIGIALAVGIFWSLWHMLQTGMLH
jgi:predicted CXXCH cytochrome family protein